MRSQFQNNKQEEQIRLSKGRPKSMTDDEKRKRIVDEGWALFMSQGYKGMTMANIASEAHMSLSTVYGLFPGKINLFSAVVDRHRRDMIALPGNYDDLPVNVALEKIFWLDLDQKAELSRLAFVQKLMAESQEHPELTSVFDGRGPIQSLKLLKDWLIEQKERGHIQFEDATITAKMLLDIAFGMSSPKLTDNSQPSAVDDRKRYLSHCFKLVANGLLKRQD
nr:TetR/AcrR family transcriptional regulator [uncultured Cohaesibacter sp.]